MTDATTTRPAYWPTDLRLFDLYDAVLSPGVRAVSTDVFDTLVWRQVPEPVDAFPLVAERLRARDALSPSVSARAFGQLRRIAERRARTDRHRLVEQTEVKLSEIYSLIPPWVFSGAAHEVAMEAELQVETELLVPDLDIVGLLAAGREAGKKVVAVSDTYFSEEHLRRLLSQPLLADVHFDRIFTSSDHRMGKTGGLFEIVLRDLDLSPEQVVHVGDNHAADVHHPGLLGIASFYFDRRPQPFGKLAEAEAPFLPEAAETTAEGSVISGLAATRAKVLSRREILDVPEALQPFWHYGATVLGPVFTGFAEWVHEHCEATGVRRVGCLMREGAFLGQLLGHANPYLNGEVEALPLWLNRDLCLRASIAEASAEELGRLLIRRSAPTVSGISQLLGIPLSTMPGWVSHAGTSLEDPVIRDNFLAAVSDDERVRATVVQRSRALRERIVAYVESFCVDDDAPLTVVDLGWGASIQGLLHQTLSTAGRARDMVGLYMVTHEAAGEQVVQGIQAYGFLGEYGVPNDAVKLIMRSPELLEQICMPPHGTQLGLREDFEPELAPADLPPMQLVEAEVVRKGVLAYQREWARYQTALPGKVGRLSQARHLLRPILLRSVVAPTKEEVVTFGSWRHDEGQGSARTDQIVDPAEATRLRYMTPAQARDLPMTDVYWPFASATLVDEHWPALMKAAAAGEIAWDAFGSPLETGNFRIEARGVDVPASSHHCAIPVRNRFGLSAATTTLRAPFVQEVVIRPSQTAMIIRFDWITVRVYRQGDAEPLVVRFEADEMLPRWGFANCFSLGQNVFVCPEGSAELTLPMARLTRRVVFRVDVECAFAGLPIPPVLPGEGRFGNLQEAEAIIAGLENSVSWRITAPLRTAKRKLR